MYKYYLISLKYEGVYRKLFLSLTHIFLLCSQLHVVQLENVIDHIVYQCVVCFCFVLVNALLFLSLVFKVPCYVFDSDGKKHDLNPLIKVTDGYLVDDSDDSVDFYINVCRNLGEYVSQPCPGSVLFLKKKLFKDCLSAAVGIGDIRHLYWRQKRIRNETRFF